MIKKQLYGFVGGFFVLVLTPVLAMLTGVDLAKDVDEKRTLSDLPAWSLNESFTQDFEAYLNDNFGFRAWLVATYNSLKIEYFKVSSNPKLVLLGKDKFMFYNLTDDQIYGSYTHRNAVSDLELIEILEKQQALKTAVENKGVRFVTGFFPNKHTIYPEKFSPVMQLQVDTNEVSFADQLLSLFQEHNYSFVDVRQALKSSKSGTYPIYRKIDTHWNAYGAFVAYQSLCEQTKEELGLKPYALSDFDVTWHVTQGGGLIDMLGVESVSGYSDSLATFTCKHPEGTYIQVADDTLPNGFKITLNEHCLNKQTALVFRDSYTTALMPFISAHYQKVVYISNHTIGLHMIDRYKADVVMCFRVERYLNGMKGVVLMD